MNDKDVFVTLFQEIDNFINNNGLLDYDELALISRLKSLGINETNDSGISYNEIINNWIEIIQFYKSINIQLISSKVSFKDYYDKFELIKELVKQIIALNELWQDSTFKLHFRNLGEEILQNTICQFINKKSPKLFNFLNLIGIIDVVKKSGSINSDSFLIIRGSYFSARFNFDRCGEILGDPFKFIKLKYFNNFPFLNKSDANLSLNNFYPILSTFIDSLGFSSAFGIKDDNFDFGPDATLLSGSLFTAWMEKPYLDLFFGFTLCYSTTESGGLGLIFIPYGNWNINKRINNWNFELNTSNSITSFSIDHNGKIIFPSSFLDNNFNIETKIKYLPEDISQKMYQIGSGDESNLQLNGLEAILKFSVSHGKVSFFSEILFKDCIFTINGSNGDNFISKIIPGTGLKSSFNIGIGWSSLYGIFLSGSVGLEAIYIINKKYFNTILIKTLAFNLKIDNLNNLRFNSILDFEFKLGPIQCNISQIGLKSELLVDSNNLLSISDFNLMFKPPSGIGINIDTDAVKGGGYLYINTEEGRYAGVAGLSIKDKIKLSAFGLINTKFPDGRKGYSFLIFVSAEFSPVQLGFGFTLSGVGGLVGIHRSVNIDKLREGVKTKAYDRLLFPQNPVENALEIIADLDAIFPMSEDRFVFGIMGKIGWGSPTLITIDLGLIIEVPNPVKLAILGVVKAILPSEEKAILKLQVNFLGVIDFGKKQLSFDATIYDSRLLTFSLAGDMAVRLSWGSNSNFLMSVGGFHPSYQPPPQLISMKRLTLNLLGGDNPRLTLTTYFAVTSNTVQFGAKVELYVKVASKLTAEGGFGFDALFQFNPFYMKIMAAAYLAIKWSGDEKFSISLSASLEGPKPWNVDGVAEIKIFFIKYKVKVQKTWGQPQDSPLPSVSVTPLLVEAMKKVENWSSELASGKQQLVTLRKIVTEESIMLPEGVLVISQKVLPLNLNIQLFGTQEVGDGGQHAIADFYINGNIETSKTYVKEDFVPAHFRKMSETEKLSGPSFQKYDGGIRIDGMNKLQGSDIKSKEIEYELIISVPEPPLEDQDPIIPIVPIEKPKIKEMVEVHQAMVKGSKAGQSSLSASKNIAPLAPKPIVVKEEEYGVVKISDLTLLESSALCASFTEAQDYYLAKVGDDIAWKNKLKIIPKFEIQTA